MNKNYSLEGLRGVAALIVFISHAAFGFYPFTQTGKAEHLRSGFDSWIWNHAVHFTYSGELAVSIFFVLSGYVLTRKYIKSPDVSLLTQAAAKRYIRLGLPVFVAVLIGYILMAFDAVPATKGVLPQTFVWSVYQRAVSLPTALRDGVYGALLFGDAGYDYVLWTIQIEFYGSLMIFAFFAVFGPIRYNGIAALIVSLVLMKTVPIQGTLLSLFFAGAYLNYDWITNAIKTVAIPMLLVGLFIGGYDSSMPVYAGVARFANYLQFGWGIKPYWPLFFVGCGAVLIVASVLASPALQRALSTSPIAWLGRVSFGMYLVHTFVLASVGAAVFRILEPHLPYWASAALSSGLALAVALLTAEIFTRFVDLPATRLANSFARSITVRPCTPDGHLIQSRE
ncbi:acyltransferase [Caballeronia sp. INDeC2]|uniref:acyltransferase family protein n=1 Tax=Caballeronia sp. INDeC2 TaxID=2921747 RepID=UPI002028DF2E|nr:acyltransferase [Caballeronia sp. INDeC2]